MSQENVEIVRRMLIEFDRSQRLTEAWAPDFVWEVGYPPAPTSEYHGHHSFLEDWLNPYEDWEQQLDDVLDAEGNQVVAVLHHRGRLSGSENWVDLRYTVLYKLEGGLIRRARLYPGADGALEAAGHKE